MFYESLKSLPIEGISHSILSKSAGDVRLALHKKKRDLEDFKALISPAAVPFLEDMASISHTLTAARFGKTIQMYIPIYLSNECNNICTYCGFSQNLDIPRKTLDKGEILQEIRMVREMGYEHVLIVTGEHHKNVNIDYFCEALETIKPHFSQVSMEVQPLSEQEYRRLIDHGVDTVLVYQETYHPEAYKKYHPRGKKANYRYRLDTCDRLGRAGMHKMGIGVLLGLEDWRVDSFLCAAHLDYLEKKYWRSRYSISFPRLRTCAQDIPRDHQISDRDLVQLICAYRLFNAEVELSISTREQASFRDQILKLGVTSMSAESKTNPGGYSEGKTSSLNQFEICDHRTTDQVCRAIIHQGYEPVWKDWDGVFGNH